MIAYFVRFFIIVVLYFVFLLFPFSSYTAPEQFSLRFFLEHSANQLFEGYTKANTNSSFARKNGIPFARLLSEEGFSQYRVNRISDEGKILSSFRIPPQKELHNGQETIFIGGSGFLTYPQDGSLFIWYPRLGNNVFFFDSEGRFLWNLQNSQYFKSFPNGRWLLSVSGDQSRFQIRQPNLETLLDVEGVLMNDFVMASFDPASSRTTNNKEQKSYFACAGFLNGDIVFLNPNQKSQERLHGRHLLKSLNCNFSHNIFAVQLEEQKDGKPYDVLHAAIMPVPQNSKEKSDAQKVQEKKQEETFADWTFSYPLSKYYPYKIPLAVSTDAKVLSFLLPSEAELPARVFLLDISSGKLLYELSLSQEESNPSVANFSRPDDWRVNVLKNIFLFWNNHSLYVVGKNGLVFEKNFKRILSFKIIQNNVYLDTKEGIFSYALPQDS